MFSQDYELRNDGQRSAVNETREGGATVRIQWTYDALNRLTNENYNSSDNTKDYVAAFTFDLSGNRKQKTQTGNFQPATTTYTVNDRDQLVSEVTGGVTVNNTYDANGSLTVKGTESFAWDLRNRMKSATIAGVTTVYGYDSANQRISQQTGTGAVTVYVNDKANTTGYPQIIEEKAGATPGRSYAIGHSVVAQSDATVGSITYFLRDGHGSNRGLISAAGLVTGAFDYQAFGEAIGFTAASAGTIHLFGGDAEYDAVTGNYYHDARWRWGHLFTSLDSFEANASTLHKYVYADGNPVTGYDPSGHFTVTELAGSVANIMTQLLARVQPALRVYQAAERIQTALGFLDWIADFQSNMPKLQGAIAQLVHQAVGNVANITTNDLADTLVQVGRDMAGIALLIAQRHGGRLSEALYSRELASSEQHNLVIYLPTLGGPFSPDRVYGKVPGLEIGGMPVEFRAGGTGGRLYGFGLAKPKKDRSVKSSSYMLFRMDWHAPGAFPHRQPGNVYFRLASGRMFHWQIPESPKEARGGFAGE